MNYNKLKKKGQKGEARLQIGDELRRAEWSGVEFSSFADE